MLRVELKPATQNNAPQIPTSKTIVNSLAQGLSNLFLTERQIHTRLSTHGPHV
jgi:hypothetical protein